MTKRATTIKDIAQRLGLSSSTVSRALNDSWEIKQETKDLVLKTAEEMDYHSNLQAVSLATKRSNTIGLIVPELMNSFFPLVIRGVQRVLREAGIRLLIMQSNEMPEEENINIKYMQQYNVDGIIISTAPNCEYNSMLYQKMIDDGIPIVFFNRVCNSVEAPKVIIDNTKMSFNVVRHLLEQGCRNIVHLAGPPNLSISDERKNGYLRALGFYDIPVNSDYILPSGIFENDGYEAMQRVLDAGIVPDGVFAFNDPVAIGAIKVLKNRGLRIPQDVAVAGFSQSRAALIIEPNLTTVEQPTEKMGEIAANLLLRRLKNNIADNTTIILDAKLNIRESTLKNGTQE